MKKSLILILVISFLAHFPLDGNAEEKITAAQVRDAIRHASEYLISQQSKTKGNWPEYQGQPGGVTALCTLALLEAGVAKDHPAIVKAADYLRSLEPKMTYSTSLQTMVFCALGEKKDIPSIRANVRWLEDAQIKRLGDDRNDNRHGSWSYSNRGGRGDNSNTQFAMLALHEASQAGIEVRQSTWEKALGYWLHCQKGNGSWGYTKNQPETGSMTCAGISSLIIAMEKLAQFNRDATVRGDEVYCCGESEEETAARKLHDALDWLGRKFSAEENPIAPEFRAALKRVHLLYYFYGLERVGRLSGQRFFLKRTTRVDWFREVAHELLKYQDDLTGKFQNVGHGESDSRIATALALLFLSKGRRPVVISKYKHEVRGREWDLHRRGVHNLTQSLERRWKKRLTWQTIEARVANVNDLLETPVLFISGRNAFAPSDVQKKTLKEYVDQGGFIFAEACDGDGCDGKEFAKTFRNVMAELFGSEMRRLEDTHPIYFAENRVLPSTGKRDLEGLDACCRTSVVLCPSTLSCYWDLKPIGLAKEYPESIQKEIDECVALGQNVLAYATNRQVKAKLERPKKISSEGLDKDRQRGTLNIAKLNHNGGGNDAPNALANMLNVARNELDMNETISLRTRLIAPDDPALFEYPIMFIHGRRQFEFTATQRKNIAAFIKRGGVIFGDAICASPQFAESFRQEIAKIFPEAKLTRLSAEHPIFTPEFRGYNIRSVTLRTPSTSDSTEGLASKLTKTVPYLEGLQIDERLAVIFSPYDLSCAMENSASLECKGYIKEDAAKIGLNILLFSLQQ